MSFELPHFVNQIVAAIKKRNDAPASTSHESWTSMARAQAQLMVEFGIPLSPQNIPNVVKVIINEANQRTKKSAYVPPPTCEDSASALGTDNDKKRKYENEILPAGFVYGAFVHVPSFIAFLKAMNKSHEFTPTARKIMDQEVTVWCPKEGSTTDLETPRSCHLSRILSQELLSENFTVAHQTPILPQDKKSSKQDVNIAVFCETTSTHQGHVAVLVEYKPWKNFDDFEAQAACYGTDYMGISRRSVIVVQVHGTHMTRLYIRAFGIVPWPSGPDESQYRKTLLMEGSGEDGLRVLISGIKGYLHSYMAEKQGVWMEHWLSNVTALHKSTAVVVKGYDYRGRNVVDQDRRQPNIALVREFIDPNAEQLLLGDDLCVVSTTFYGRSEKWFDPVPATRLGQMLENLQKLHGKGFVHGDIRLLNCILHKGLIVDFDFCRQEGNLCPSALRHLKEDGSDGKRARDVTTAIENHNIGCLKMMKAHDLESMLYPVIGNAHEPTFSTWWIKNVQSKTTFSDIFALIAPLKNWPETQSVELTYEVDSGQVMSIPEQPQGTDSPQGKQ